MGRSSRAGREPSDRHLTNREFCLELGRQLDIDMEARRAGDLTHPSELPPDFAARRDWEAWLQRPVDAKNAWSPLDRWFTWSRTPEGHVFWSELDHVIVSENICSAEGIAEMLKKGSVRARWKEAMLRGV